jgi:hypothetical protein
MRYVARTLAVLTVAVGAVAVTGGPASAWLFRASVQRTCTASGVRLEFHFTNTEPNAAQAMTVTATDVKSNRSVALGGVGAGQSVTGTIDTSLQSVPAGKIRIDMAWVANPKGHDQDFLSYGAFGCDPPPAVPDGINGWTLAVIVGGTVGVGAWRRRHRRYSGVDAVGVS